MYCDFQNIIILVLPIFSDPEITDFSIQTIKAVQSINVKWNKVSETFLFFIFFIQLFTIKTIADSIKRK